MDRDDNLLVEQFPPQRRQLRVAMVTETFAPEVNGVAMTLGRLVAGLRRRGHAVQLVRPRQHADEAPSRDPRFEELLSSGLPIPNYPGLRFGLPAKGTLTRLWSRDRPDVVHVATEGPLGWSAVAAARKLKLPVSSGFHTNFDSYSRHYGIGWLKGSISRYLKGFHNRTDLTLVPTRRLADDLGQEGYRNVRVLSRGVDSALFNPGRRSTALRARWTAGPDDLVVACVGRLAPEKNIDLVLRTFAAVKAARPDARMLFVGGGPLALALGEQHPGHIFAGVRHGEDLAAHYASADLFLFPSLTETFGNATAEALASGLGVVAYDCAAAGDLIDDGVQGILVPPGDEGAYVEAAVAVAREPERLAALRARAPETVAVLDWERIHDLFADTLLDLVAGHRDRENVQGIFVVAPD